MMVFLMLSLGTLPSPIKEEIGRREECNGAWFNQTRSAREVASQNAQLFDRTGGRC